MTLPPNNQADGTIDLEFHEEQEELAQDCRRHPQGCIVLVTTAKRPPAHKKSHFKG
jgi:hypothetical protein